MHMQGGAVASGGLRELIPTVARTAVAAGVDGIFMEVLTQFISTPSETWQFGSFLRHACMNSSLHRPAMLRRYLLACLGATTASYACS